MASSSSPNAVLAQIELARHMGVVDDTLNRVYALKQYQSDPQFFLKFLFAFTSDARVIITKLESSLSQNLIDFEDLDEDAIKLLGCSSSAGAFKIKDACTDLRMAIENGSRNGCIQAVTVAKREFVNVEPHMNAIIEVEREDIL